MHYACVRGHRKAVMGAAVAALVIGLLAGACGSSAKATPEPPSSVAPKGFEGGGYSEAASDEVVVMCDRYGSTLGDQAENQVQLKVNAAMKELREAKVDVSAWSNLPASAVVARCDFTDEDQFNAPPPTTHCSNGALVGVTLVRRVYLAESGVTAVVPNIPVTPC